MTPRSDIQFYRSLQKAWALLVDPDRIELEQLPLFISEVEKAGAGFILVGGSHMSTERLSETVKAVKSACSLPVVLFPGPGMSLCSEADGILFLSLLSGRNPELLIGTQVQTAMRVYHAGLEAVGTAYMLVDGGKMTTAHYVSQSLPLPADKPEIAASTALAARFMGFPLCFLDAGSGAERPVSVEIIRSVKKMHGGPLIVGGGLCSREDMETAWHAGADIVVIGTLFEKSPELIREWKS